MARRRFFVDQVRNGQAELAGDDALHLARILRAEPGQQFELSDNHQAFLAEIVSVHKNQVKFRILEPLASAPPAARITLLASLFKFDRFEWMIEKATELGVTAIVPVAAARSGKGLLEAASKRVARWRKIARESSQQARRLHLPEIFPPEPLLTAAARIEGLRLYLEEQPGAPPLVTAATPAEAVSLAAGPEGGWEEEERTALRRSGWTAVSLGENVLRAETAAIAGIAIVSNLLRTRP